MMAPVTTKVHFPHQLPPARSLFLLPRLFLGLFSLPHDLFEFSHSMLGLLQLLHFLFRITDLILRRLDDLFRRLFSFLRNFLSCLTCVAHNSMADPPLCFPPHPPQVPPCFPLHPPLRLASRPPCLLCLLSLLLHFLLRLLHL